MKDIISLLHLASLTLLLICSPAPAQNIPDFLVNEHASIDGSEQSIPDIGGDGNGNYVLTWMDARNGSNLEVYAQIYLNETTPLGENFKVSDEGETATKYNPSIAVGPDLNFVITWLDKRNGWEWDVYAQRFSNDGTALGNNFKVNNEPGNEEQEQPCVAMEDFGNFTIIWSDEKNGDWDIWGQRYSADGTTLGDNFKISDDTGNELQYWPCCSCDKSGNLVVAWVDKRYYDDYDIYAQRYLPDGTAVGNNFRVNTDTEYSMQLRPDISFDDEGDFIIAWEDQRNGDWDIYAQRYLGDGTTLDDNFKLNDDTPNTSQRKVSISSDLVGNFVVSWEDDRFDYKDVFAQRFSNDATPLGNNFKVNTDTTNTYQFYPEIAADDFGNFWICWENQRYGYNGEIFLQAYLSDGTTLGENSKVNDDEGSENQSYPSIAVDGNDNFIIAWNDMREGDENIYAQRYSADGSPLGENFKVNDDDMPIIIQWTPSVAADAEGNFIIAWGDLRSGYDSDIYAQRYASDGTPIDSNFKVNYLGANMHYGPKVVCYENGDFIICWGDAEDGGLDRIRNHNLMEKELSGNIPESKSGEPDIWAQRFSADGSPQGENFKVNDDNGPTTYQQYPDIAISESGEFIIAWEDMRNGDWDIFYQRYEYDGTAIGNNTLVETDVFSENQGKALVAYNIEGDFTIAWSDKRNGDYDVYMQHFWPGGTPMGGNFRVNTGLSNGHQTGSSIASGADGYFVVCWNDMRTGNDDIYGQRFWSDVNSYGIYGGNYRVTDNDDYQQNQAAMAMDNTRIFTTWRDNHCQQFGYDIWASVSNWNYWVGVKEPPIQHTNYGSILHQNFPNPFSSSTTIKFDLTEPTIVKIEIFNNFGQRMELLLNESLYLGQHEVEFDARDLPIGVYYYRIEAKPHGNPDATQQVKRMVVVR